SSGMFRQSWQRCSPYRSGGMKIARHSGGGMNPFRNAFSYPSDKSELRMPAASGGQAALQRISAETTCAAGSRQSWGSVDCVSLRPNRLVLVRFELELEHREAAIVPAGSGDTHHDILGLSHDGQGRRFVLEGLVGNNFGRLIVLHLSLLR